VIRKLRRDRVAIERTAEEKLRHPAMLLLQEAAFAMGESGIEGRENPAALQLYVTAMRMLEWREKKLKEEGSGELLEEDNVLEAFPRQKRSHCGRCAKVLYFNTTVDEQSKIVEYFVPSRYTARVESVGNMTGHP